MATDDQFLPPFFHEPRLPYPLCDGFMSCVANVLVLAVGYKKKYEYQPTSEPDMFPARTERFLVVKFNVLWDRLSLYCSTI